MCLACLLGQIEYEFELEEANLHRHSLYKVVWLWYSEKCFVSSLSLILGDYANSDIGGFSSEVILGPRLGSLDHYILEDVPLNSQVSHMLYLTKQICIWDLVPS